VPIYEYECTRCGGRFEMIQSFSDKPLKTCEQCGGKLHKLVSECAFHLKGSGWYVTDYGKSGKAAKSTKATGKDKGKSKDKPKTDLATSTTKSESSSSATTDKSAS